MDPGVVVRDRDAVPAADLRQGRCVARCLSAARTAAVAMGLFCPAFRHGNILSARGKYDVNHDNNR